MDQLKRFPIVPEMVGFTVANSIVCFLALAVVVLRIYSRIITKAGFGWDDGFIVASMTTGLALLIIESLICTWGVGYPIYKIGDNLPFLLKIITVHNLLFVVTTLTNKLSILCFYLRIFSSGPKMRIAVIIVIILFIVWGFACTIDLLAICHPYLNETTDKYCDRAAMMKDLSALCVFGDMVVLLLPMPAIWNLHANLRTKIKITLLLLLGVVTTVIAFLRCISIAKVDLNSPDMTITTQESLAYSVLEPNMGILCASLPMVHHQFSAWKDKFLNRIRPFRGTQLKSSPSEDGQTRAGTSGTPIPLGDPRFQYTVSITAGNKPLSRTRTFTSRGRFGDNIGLAK